jgi:hypothetical protein
MSHCTWLSKSFNSQKKEGKTPFPQKRTNKKQKVQKEKSKE